MFKISIFWWKYGIFSSYFISAGLNILYWPFPLWSDSFPRLKSLACLTRLPTRLWKYRPVPPSSLFFNMVLYTVFTKLLKCYWSVRELICIHPENFLFWKLFCLCMHIYVVLILAFDLLQFSTAGYLRTVLHVIVFVTTYYDIFTWKIMFCPSYYSSLHHC